MIPFIDLQAQRKRLGQPLEDAILSVVRSGAYIMGPEIAAFEKAMGEFGEAPHVLSCASGTDALVLPLMAWEIGPGDAVFCPAFTFAATAEAMPLVGASPVFVDILPDTLNIDPTKLEAAIQAVKAESRTTNRARMTNSVAGCGRMFPALSMAPRKRFIHESLATPAISSLGAASTFPPIEWPPAAGGVQRKSGAP